MSKLYDLAIVGLGPAGATLARLLAPLGLKLAALDRKQPEGSHGFAKACGGLLSPGAQRELALLGLNLPNEILAGPQIFSVKTIDLPSGLIRRYQRCYLNIDRQRFDRWLIGLIPEMAVDLLRPAELQGLRLEGDIYKLNYLQRGRSAELRCRFLVGADGAASITGRLLGGRRKIRRYLCIQEYYPLANNSQEPYACFFDENISDCYGWLNNKDGRLILGLALPRLQPARRLARAKEKLAAFGYEFSQPLLKREACLVSRPASLSQLSFGRRPGLFWLGEAAGLVSPSSLEGISYALGSARALARALSEAPNEALAAYAAALRPLRLKILSRLAKVPFMYWPPLRRLVMASRLTALD